MRVYACACVRARVFIERSARERSEREESVFTVQMYADMHDSGDVAHAQLKDIARDSSYEYRMYKLSGGQ